MNNLDLSSRTTSADEKRWRNSTATYGLIAVLFHWTIALLFIAQLALGYLMSGDDVDPALGVGSPGSEAFMGLHRGISRPRRQRVTCPARERR
jgi:hypothetical protein